MIQPQRTSLWDELTEVLQPDQIKVGEAVSERYYHIWRMQEPLEAAGVVLPVSTEEVSAIMRICHTHKQAVAIHGGRTNMVGSTETQPDELVISLERMNQIEEIDEQSRTITVQAGVILESVQEAAAEHQLLFPLNFGAKGSAQMGGVLATNAGGMRVFRYGMTRNLVLGLEAVLADGTIVSSMKKIIKDNSGYDLKQLFIGSEGTLGIVTRAVLRLMEMPQSRNCAFVALADYEQVVRFLKYMDRGLAGTLSAFELFWREAYQALTTPPSTSPPPLPDHYPYYVLLESLGSEQEHDEQQLIALLEGALEENLILDAVPAQSGSDREWFWQIREDVGNIVSRCPNDQHFDISLPIPLIGPLVNELIAALWNIPDVSQVFSFGHVADGNIHFVIGKKVESEALIRRINEVIYTPLKDIGGSVSAEHGIGHHKKAYLPISRNEQEISLMKMLKQSLDPHNLLNPGKVLDL